MVLNPREDFEGRKERAYAQLELLKDNVRIRHQSVITIAIGSVSMLVVASFVQMSLWLSIAIVGILLMNVVVWWFDILTVRQSLSKSQAILYEVLPKNKEKIEEINSKVPWAIRNFPELTAGFCTIVVLFLAYSLFTAPSVNKHWSAVSDEEHRVSQSAPCY